MRPRKLPRRFMGFDVLDLFRTFDEAIKAGEIRAPVIETLPPPPESVTGEGIIKYLSQIGHPVQPVVLCRAMHISQSLLQSMITRLTYDDPHLAEDDRGRLLYVDE